MKALFPDQEAALLKVRRAMAAGSRRPILQAPTGAGKTLMGSRIIQGALNKGNRVIWTAPRIELIDQTVVAFYDEGVRDVGVIQAEHPMTDYSKPVQVASVASLQNRVIPEAQLVLVDEAHIRSQFLFDWMERPEWRNVPFIGLSATPWSRGLGKHYDRLVVASTTAELIDRGRLVRFRVFAPTHPDLSGVPTVNTEHGRDYSPSALSAAMRKGSLVGDIVHTWLAQGGGRPTLCFAVDRIHAKTIQEQFQRVGVPCGYMDAHTPDHERKAIRDAFANGDLPVVCNVGVLTTGVDWDVRCIILARPTKSEILYVQIVGRGLRTAPPTSRFGPKDDCLILDHSDTTLRLGFVTDIHHEELDDGAAPPKAKSVADEKLPKECPRCHYVRPAGVSACAHCGYVAEVVTKVKTVPGKLVDLTEARQRKAAEGPTLDEKVEFLGQLRALAVERGWKPGRVSALFYEKFGHAPLASRLLVTQAAEAVSKEVRDWVTSRNIAYAKRQGARRA